MGRFQGMGDLESVGQRVAVVTGGARGLDPSFITGQDFIVDGFQWVL